MNKALFLDRDGILNLDKGYVYKWEELVWMDEVYDMIKMANERGYKVIILTNQSGIHRGMYTRDDVHLLHKQMQDHLENLGLHIDDWFYCAEMDSEKTEASSEYAFSGRKSTISIFQNLLWWVIRPLMSLIQMAALRDPRHF